MIAPVDGPPAAIAIFTTGVAQHIDAATLCPAAGSSLCALATSSLTGDVWDGTLTILDVGAAEAQPAPAQVVARVIGALEPR